MTDKPDEPYVPPRGFLTVQDVADRLEISPSGVHKLIQRDKLYAIKRSERNTVIPAPALDAYVARMNGTITSVPVPRSSTTNAEARDAFRADTGKSPEFWIADWKKDLIEDTPENMSLAIHAMAIILERSEAGHVQEVPAYQSQRVASRN